MNTKFITDCKVTNINSNVSPDFCDAFIEKATIVENDTPRNLTETELEELNNNADFIHQQVIDWIY